MSSFLQFKSSPGGGRSATAALPVIGFALVLLVLAGTGCRETAQPPRRAAGGPTAFDSEAGEDLFQSALVSLMQIEDRCDLKKYEWPPIGSGDQIQRRLSNWVETRDPPIAWEPVPNEMAQRRIVERFNRWSPSHMEEVQWESDPLIESLPPQLREVPQLKSLEGATFSNDDARFLELAGWLSEMAEHTAGGMTNDLERAIALFDWTVRNIQLEADETAPPMRSPWRTMLMGRGSKEGRALVFILLARQLGMQVVMLAFPDTDAQGNQTLRDWLPALLSDGHLYLFDPWLGFPVPGPGGQGVATLSDVAKDDAILRHLDLSQTRTYPVSADQLASVTALVAASPESLSRRMKLLESRLVGQRRLVLSANPREWVEPLKACAHVTDVKLWPYPYSVMRHAMSVKREQRQQAVDELKPLMLPFYRSEGRGSLQQDAGQWNPRMTPYRKIAAFDVLFIYVSDEAASKGNLIAANYPVGPEGNVDLGPNYGSVQVAGLTLEGARSAIEDQLRMAIQDADVSVRFAGAAQLRDNTKRERVSLWRGRIRHLSGRWSGEQDALENRAEQNAVIDYLNSRVTDDQLTNEQVPEALRDVLTLSKQHATYWLGLLSYERGQPRAARLYFDTTLEKWPDGPWTGGARFNLARVYEATEDWDKAIELYSTDISPQLHGNRLRGRWLKEKQAADPTTP